MQDDHRGRVIAGFIAILVVLHGGAIGYYLLGGGKWTFADCVYMTVITLTTVGYGEILPDFHQVPYAQTFTIFLIMLGMGVFLYFASTLTAFIVEGDLRRAYRRKRMRKRMDKMRNHIIVCGAGSTGRHAIEELIATQTPIVAIDKDEAVLEQFAEEHPRAQFSYIVGDATDDHVLVDANVAHAKGVVVALSNDKDNLYLVVTARQLNSKAKIVARCSELSLVDKLKRAGADRVVSPNFIGGMRMVSELIRPAVVRFLDEMLRDKESATRIEEVCVAGGELAGMTLGEADIRQRFGASVLAVQPPGIVRYDYNPDAAYPIEAGTILVVLGARDEIAKLKALAESE